MEREYNIICDLRKISLHQSLSFAWYMNNTVVPLLLLARDRVQQAGRLKTRRKNITGCLSFDRLLLTPLAIRRKTEAEAEKMGDSSPIQCVAVVRDSVLINHL